MSRATIAAAICASTVVAAADAPRLATIARGKNAHGSETLAVTSGAERPGTPVFQAFVSETWPEGLVPVFAIENERGFELRRLPPRGLENSTDPLFFALPRADETNALKIAGRWDCVATNSEGTKHYVAWELAVEGERVTGRLDQRTDYRFAFVSGGSFRSNHFELAIEYIMDRYTLAGHWRDGRLAGTWRHLDAADGGTWIATRPGPAFAVPFGHRIVPLFEWRRGENERRYSTNELSGGPGWKRSSNALCRVWAAIKPKLEHRRSL